MSATINEQHIGKMKPVKFRLERDLNLIDRCNVHAVFHQEYIIEISTQLGAGH